MSIKRPKINRAIDGMDVDDSIFAAFVIIAMAAIFVTSIGLLLGAIMRAAV